MPHSQHGGRHELGQNFLVHHATIARITHAVVSTRGSILELGCGDGALTRHLPFDRRHVIAIDLDEHRIARLSRMLPAVTVTHADALTYPIRHAVVVGNIPFHLTTPILRRLLHERRWTTAILVTQWEVAKKRAGVGGATMLTAQSAPWFEFALLGRVPRHGFRPAPSVDGGILRIVRRDHPLVPLGERRAYQRFVGDVFTGRGGTLDHIVARATRARLSDIRAALKRAGVPERGLPRDLGAAQWADVWRTVRDAPMTRR